MTQAGIWYLDLTGSGYRGGAADLVVDFSDVTTVNGVGIGAVSISSGGLPIELHATADGGIGARSVTLTTTVDDTFNVASFNANGGGAVSVDPPLAEIYASGGIGSARGAAGYQAGVAAGSHAYSWTTEEARKAVAAAFVVHAAGSKYDSWISGFDVGGQTGFGDDPDRDGLANGLEAWLGTHPGRSNTGLAGLSIDGNTATFTHPRNESMPDDLIGFYQWSPNLVDWYAGDGVDGPPAGPTVNIASIATGSTSIVTVVPGGVIDRLFLRAGVVLD
jgi:hypothetical protein